MGREVRMVPATWEHPKRADGSYQPMYDSDYEEVAREWIKEAILWSNGENRSQDKEYEFYWDWEGPPPDKEYYMPNWGKEERTHLMMYETTSEGTPISPPFATPEELAQWLFDTGASAFGSMTATYEEWLATAERGWAVSAIGVVGKGLVSGVEGMKEDK